MFCTLAIRRQRFPAYTLFFIASNAQIASPISVPSKTPQPDKITANFIQTYQYLSNKPQLYYHSTFHHIEIAVTNKSSEERLKLLIIEGTERKYKSTVKISIQGDWLILTANQTTKIQSCRLEIAVVLNFNECIWLALPSTKEASDNAHQRYHH